jgi:hypothetical protein
MQPTIVAVHCALAEPASWDRFADSLVGVGHPGDRARDPLARGGPRRRLVPAPTPGR